MAIHDAHDGAHTPLVGLGDRLESDEEFDALFEADAVLVALAQPVEELAGRELAGVAIEFAMCLVFLCGAGEEQPVQRCLAVYARGRQCSRICGVQLLFGFGKSTSL